MAHGSARQKLLSPVRGGGILFCLSVCGAVSLCAQKAAPLGDGWPAYGGDPGGQRYSRETEINVQNVKNLQVAWTMHTHALEPPAIRASFEATPVLWDKTLYFDTPFNVIFAVDAVTGKVRWSFDPKIDRQKPMDKVTSRGVSLWHSSVPAKGVCKSDVVLMATTDRRLISRDARTGAACEAFGNGGTVDLAKGVAIADIKWYSFTSAPTIIGNTIVLGSAVADNETTFAASGAVRGFDVTTGVQKWSWEPLQWTLNQKVRMAGSGNAWSTISADAANDLVFVPTGSPSNDFIGTTRLGDNRDADSIVALRASTGQKVWAFQLVHHDLWDYDTPSQPVLFTFRDNIPAVAVTTKTSMVYVFNRLTGEPLYPIVERPVASSKIKGEQAWATQPFSTLPSLTPLSLNVKDVHMRDPADQAYCEKMMDGLDNFGIFTPPSEKGSLIYPGNLGGANWGSSALDPKTSVLFTRVSNFPFVAREVNLGTRGRAPLDRAERAVKRAIPEWAGGYPVAMEKQFVTPDSGGEERNVEQQLGTTYYLERQGLMAKSGAPCIPTPYGAIVAMNLNTGKVEWSVPHGSMAGGQSGSVGAGGVIVTAGGLLFAASSSDGSFRAYDETNGKLVWQFALPAPANATPMTYTIDHKQYVVIAAGGHGFIAPGQSDQVIAFALPSQKSQKKK